MLKPEASTALYRVAQEALNNVERHSGATRVDIRIWSVGGRVRMTISDNGNGFDETIAEGKKALGGGLGLRNMQERLAHFGGLLLIKTTSAGTILTAMLPRSATVNRTQLKDAA
jgi:two-component system NarL family sensor kinase